MSRDQPNVLFVLTDQMRAHAMGCTGNDQIRTPTMDRLASEGVLVDSAYTTKPMCTPARGSILTGQYPHRHRTVHNSLSLPSTGETFAYPLREAGYSTGYVGKWHLDEGTPDYRIPARHGPGYVPPGPRRQGFEFWKAYNTNHEHLRGHPHFDEHGDPHWEEGYQPAIQTDIAIDFLEDHASLDADRPFFLFVSWGPPHPPFKAPEEYGAMYEPDALSLRPNVPPDNILDRPHKPRIDESRIRADLAEYYGLITSLDDQLDRLLTALDERGFSDDTVVCFTSDHGEMLGSQGRCNKGAPFEESTNVPLILRYPGEFPSGTRLDAPVSLADLMPTILSTCGVPIPDAVQGRDLRPYLRGNDDAKPAAAYVEGWRIENDVPGMDDWGEWGQPWRMIRSERYMLTIDQTLQTRFFFDMVDDPYQTTNLADDPSMEETERQIRDALFEQTRRYVDREFMVRRSFIEAKLEDVDGNPSGDG